MSLFPLFVELAGRRCLVLGGGDVATRKVDGLLAAAATVTVISPAVTPALAVLAAERRLEHVVRGYVPGDLDGFALAFAATDDGAINAAVAAEGRRLGVWVNAADDPTHCDFILPSVLRRGALTVAVSTGGASPALARVVREEIEACVPAGYAALADVAGDVRRSLRARRHAPDAQTWVRALDSEVRRLAATGQVAEARRRLLERLGAGVKRAGHVALVGAGPGDPGLMTVRGLALLRDADVIVYDRLVDPRLLDEAPTARRVYAGKASGDHALPQEQINAILVHHAQRGRRVVRLKGGDPFVFGRGSEEAEALAAAGVAFEIVPGVSSAVAAPAYAGIPLTHRGLASSFTVVTGHEACYGTAVDWRRLSAPTETLVVLMGLAALPQIARTLIAHGRASSTPVAVVRAATTASQVTLTGRLDDIADRAADVAPPAVIVIGDVVRLRERIRWFSELDEVQRPAIAHA